VRLSFQTLNTKIALGFVFEFHDADIDESVANILQSSIERFAVKPAAERIEAYSIHPALQRDIPRALPREGEHTLGFDFPTQGCRGTVTMSMVANDQVHRC
jgi:hypothetical protein